MKKTAVIYLALKREHKMAKYFFTLIALLLTACSNSLQVTQLPNQTESSRLFAVQQLAPKTEQSLLTVQFLPEMWRWVQTDPLGSPLARLQLTQMGWQNDGFVMPNPQAKQLFSAIASHFSPNHPPFVFSHIQQNATGKDYFVNNKKMWQISQQNTGIKITLADKSQWYLEEIKQ